MSIYVQMAFDDQIECAAIILALGQDDTGLSPLIASYFVADAANTLVLQDGAGDFDERLYQANLIASTRAGDILPLLEFSDQLAGFVAQQQECVFGRFDWSAQ